ncbi:MAG TPA: response regulator transcription factor [Firmicutes bacterium]|nr:response regulator transcription factor [Bacillota bacterium]
MKELIVIIDDEVDIRDLVRIHIQKSGYRFNGFKDSKSFFKGLEAEIPALIILDIMLPDDDGFEICKKLKGSKLYNGIPIIILSAKDEEVDKIIGLELGADDHVCKPFSPRELIARVKAVLRRRDTAKQEKNLVYKDRIIMNTDNFKVNADREEVELTPTEFKILQLLISRPDRIFNREEILDYLWGDEKYVIDRTVDVHILNLRKKLKGCGSLIKNIRGIGYSFRE